MPTRNRPRELGKLRQRIERLREAGLDPIEVLMSLETWDRLKREYRASVPGMTPKMISAREILGVRSKIVPDVRGSTIRYFGGADLPPDQAIEDGFIDLIRLRDAHF